MILTLAPVWAVEMGAGVKITKEKGPNQSRRAFLTPVQNL